MNLQEFVLHNAQTIPDALAVKAIDGCLTYQALSRQANHFAHALRQCGVQSGDRVGIWLDKTTCAVAAMQGTLRLGAIYVPLDPLSPAVRVATIVQDCEIRVLVTTQKRASSLPHSVSVICLCIDGDEESLNWQKVQHLPDTLPPVHYPREQDIAYILYTSGSTGKPKGVCISQRNALAFINWAYQQLRATSRDHFASHAPFHFDLSVLDMYVAFAAGGCVFLIPDTLAFIASQLVTYLQREQLTIWYSVPSVLILMMEQGGLLEIELLSLRCLLFAGEAFPIQQLRRLHERWPNITLLNLYGPTETNVCTFYEVKDISIDRIKPVPIGKACSGDQVWARKEDGSRASSGENGELIVEGPTVMIGYWGQPPHGDQPYATGDIVQFQEDGDYLYIGRCDHMLKVRGYRIEPGEIEAALATHPLIREAAVLVVGRDITARLVAFIVPYDVSPSLLELKQHSARHLPRYMIVDRAISVATLPRTRNGKIDRQALLQAVQQDISLLQK